MKVIVKARHMNLTPSLRAHAEEKLGQALSRILDRPAARMEIELSDLNHVVGGTKECRVTVYVPRGKAITIHESHDDLYSAINLVHDRLLEQVKRETGRRRRHSHRQRLASERTRRATAREVLTAQPEVWENELREYEESQTVR